MDGSMLCHLLLLGDNLILPVCRIVIMAWLPLFATTPIDPTIMVGLSRK